MHVFLSPHYDDAAYSCGGCIHQLAQNGHEAQILTVMAGEPPSPLPDSPIVREIHERWQAGYNPVPVRRAEDQAATAMLGVTVRYLTVPDCIYRTHDGNALYPNEASLFGPVHADDPAWQTLQQTTPTLAIDTLTALYAPLAIGHHVDHQLVRDWALQMKAQHPALPLYLYADYPYTRQPQAIDAALSQLTIALHDAHCTYGDTSMRAKIRAMQAYSTQISTFWRDADHLAQDVRRAFAPSPSDDTPPQLVGLYAEKRWFIVS